MRIDLETTRSLRPSRRLPIILLLLDLLLLCTDSPGVQGCKPLIKLPRSRHQHQHRHRHRHRSSSPANITISVHDFGAKGDGCTDDTYAFVAAWKFACKSRSRPIIEIPYGNVYLVGPANFNGRCRSRITLLVLGTIIAPSDPEVWDGLNPQRWLYFQGVNDLEVRGGGTINGMGEKWWARSCKINATNPCTKAPMAVTFHRCKRLTVQDLTLRNSQKMHISFTCCFQVIASRLEVIAPAKSPNTDGIHISESISVLVEDSVIKTGDDCISIVTNSSNILMKNIVCGPGHGISIGSLGKGGAWDEVHNVRVDGAFISNTENGVRIKSWQGGRGYARNVIFHNVVMENVSNPIIINQYYCDSFKPCHNQTSAVKVDAISFIGISGTSATEEVIKLACSDSFPCENIILKDIQLTLNSGGTPTAYCWNALGFSSGLVYPPSCLLDVGGLIEQNVVSSAALSASAR